jgi:hypothetical protein
MVFGIEGRARGNWHGVCMARDGASDGVLRFALLHLTHCATKTCLNTEDKLGPRMEAPGHRGHHRVGGSLGFQPFLDAIKGLDEEHQFRE